MLGPAETVVDLAVPVDPEVDHIRGPEDAPVTLLEYGDFECPYCGRAEPVIRELLADRGDIHYVWRHLPLNDVHTHAQLAAEGSEAAHQQGRFWEMHDLLLEHQDELRPGDLIRYADELGPRHRPVRRRPAQPPGRGSRGARRGQRRPERRLGDTDLLHQRPPALRPYDIDTLSKVARLAGARVAAEAVRDERAGKRQGAPGARRPGLHRVAQPLPGADPAVADVDHLVEALALEERGREAAALAAAADRGDRPVPRQLRQAIHQVAVGDVDGPGDVRGCETCPRILSDPGRADSQETPRFLSDHGAMTAEPPGQDAARVLVVDDELNIAELVSMALRYAGFDVATAGTGREALDRAEEFRPHMLVLDVMLPDFDGFEVARRLAAGGRHVPILFLTARDTTEDKVRGLTLGGDDYVTKPFSVEELIARVRAILRRGGRRRRREQPRIRGPRAGRRDPRGAPGRQGDRAHRHRVPPAPLPDAQSAPRPDRAQILDHVWQYDFGGDARVLETYISYLRKKVDRRGPRLIHTVRGVGYVLRRPRN